MLLSGEAGVGKTSVLRAAAHGGPPHRLAVGHLRADAVADAAGAAGRLARSHAACAAAAVRAGRHAAEVLSGVLSMLRDPTRPTVLVVDDAQWADSATLDLLRYLGRRIESTRALLVLSYRDDALATITRCWVLSGLPARSCAPGAGALVARRRGRDGAAAGRSARGLYDVTQGNPFFVTELLAGDPQALPASVRDAVLARIAPMPPAARDVIELASVSPTQIEVEVLDAGATRAPSPSAPPPACWCWTAARCAFATNWRGAPSRHRCRRAVPPHCTRPCSMP